MFTASQYDNYSYLFDRPTFISLNPTCTAEQPIPIAGIRIGVNGAGGAGRPGLHPAQRQRHSADYSPTTGQLLSPLGTVIPMQNGPASDQFFLTFDQIGTNTHTYTDADAGRRRRRPICRPRPISACASSMRSTHHVRS